MDRFFALLTVGANVATVTLWALAISARLGTGRELWARVRDSLGESGLLIAAVVAATAMAGSLYLSEGAHFVPCLMCWYQRIAMYSLAVILVLAAARRDWGVRPYALALALLGPAISLYHYVIERQPDLEIGGDGTCAAYGPPCTTRWIDDQFGYISIPFMALSAFLLVATVLAAARVSAPENDGHGGAYDGEPDADAARRIRNHAVNQSEGTDLMSTKQSPKRAAPQKGGLPLLPILVGVIVLIGIVVVAISAVGGSDDDETRAVGPGIEQNRPVTIEGDALPVFEGDPTNDPAVGEIAPTLTGANFAVIR